MKIAFTTTGNTLMDPMDARFGRAAKFLVYNTNDNSFVLIENEHAADAQGAGIKAAETIAKAGANVLVTGECGPKALQWLKLAGIKAYTSKADTVTSSLVSFLAGTLNEIVPR
jgi:predicted Fe-Mo cluster-binding NifX family protein